MLSNIAFDFTPDEYGKVDSLELGRMGTLIRQYASGHGKHSNGRMPIRQVAEIGIDAIGKDGLENLSIPLRYLHCEDVLHRYDSVSALDMLLFMRDAGIKSLTVPLKPLLIAADKASYGSTVDAKRLHDPDTRLIELLACWYASFDAGFEATFFTMPRGMLTSAEVASYFTLSSFIELMRTAEDASDGTRMTASHTVDMMMRAPLLGMRTPLSDVMSMGNDDNLSVSYRKAARLLARHDGSFVVNGIRFEEMESGIGSVPYQWYGIPDFDVDDTLARAVMGIISMNGILPVSTIDLAEMFADAAMPDGGTGESDTARGQGILAGIMRTFRKLVIDKISKGERCIATSYVSKSRDLQRAMSVAIARQRAGKSDSVASLEMLECCVNASDDCPISLTPDAVRAAMADDTRLMDEERIGMGSYGNDVSRLMPALAVAYRMADNGANAIPRMHIVSVSDVLYALMSMRCAVSSAASDVDRKHAAAMDITNCYSEDVDVPPQRMESAEMLATLGSELGDESRVMACIGIPSMFAPTYIGMSAIGWDDRHGNGMPQTPDGFVSMLSDAFGRLQDDDDPFECEDGGSIPNQLMRMVNDRGNVMSRHGDFATLEENGVMHEQLSPVVTMLGTMEFYACLVSDGGYGRYIRDVGHITALVHDGIAAFDVYNEVAQSVNGTYDAWAGYREATNPFNSTVASATTDATRDAMGGGAQGVHADRAIRQYAVDVTAEAEYDAKCGITHGIGRGTMVASIGMVLTSRVRHVPLIVGKHGSGRMDIVFAFATWLLSDDAPASLRGSRIFAVRDDAQDVPHATEVLAAALAKTKNSILLVRDVMDLYATVTPGTKNTLRSVFDYDVRVMVISDVRGAKEVAARDPYSMDRMIRIDMSALSDDAITDVLWQYVRRYELVSRVKVSASAIRSIVGGVGIVSLAASASPEREIETLEYAISYAIGHGHHTVTDEEVRMSAKLLNGGDAVPMDDPFAAVAGQQEAKRVVTERLAASRLGLYDVHGPRNIFMFCGPSGCGKTLLASRINRALGVNDDGVLVIPMSEYSTKWEGSRLIGSAPGYVGYEQGGMLTNFVKAHPNGVLILDEIEKAHPSIIMMFLNMFDTGIIDSAQGEHVDCHKLTIVCTSNAAFDDYGSSGVIGFAQARKPTYEESVSAVREELVKRLGAPFIGRIPDIVVFEELSDADMLDAIVINYRHMASEYGKRVGMYISKVITEDDVKNIASGLLSGMNRETGVRGLWKEIEKEINGRIIATICDAGTRMS